MDDTQASPPPAAVTIDYMADEEIKAFIQLFTGNNQSLVESLMQKTEEYLAQARPTNYEKKK
jgi:hypothetical protein